MSFIVGLPLIFFVVVPWMTRRAVRRAFDSNPAAQQPTTCWITLEGIAYSNAMTRAESTWEGVFEVVETRRDFLFFFSERSALIVPKEALPSSEAMHQLRKIVQESPCENVSLK